MIAEIDIGLVAALTGDWHSVHTKAQDATRTVCGERIAHGLLLLAVERGTGGVNACLMFKRR
jgi:acyl dehydratase